MLVPLLEPGDIIIDGGNLFFQDTRRRTKDLESKGCCSHRYRWSRVARRGRAAAPASCRRLAAGVAARQGHLQAISAKVADGTPCCDWVGADGAGHFVKMVHNGIEYGDMQLISEAYFIMANALGMGADELHETFAEWNRGELDSYLIDITARILARKDPETGKPIVDVIMDTAGQKGTGKWTSQTALDLGISTPTITEAVFARCISAIKQERVAASKILSGPAGSYQGDRKRFVDAIRDALYASKICSYAQGFAMMAEASREYGWDLNFGQIALMWREGCIIRARFLERIKEAFDAQPDLANLLLAPYFKEAVEAAQENWRKVVSSATLLGIPIPAFSSAISYFDSYRRERLPANMIQAQLGNFGHTTTSVWTGTARSTRSGWLTDLASGLLLLGACPGVPPSVHCRSRSTRGRVAGQTECAFSRIATASRY